ncbi:MAG: PAS domain-containing protein [Ferruginibacter sp.]
MIYALQKHYLCYRKKENYGLIGRIRKKQSNLFHLSPQPMWLYDPETLKFIRVNKAAVEHFGYSQAEFLHMNIMDIRPPSQFAKNTDFN